MEEFKDLYLWLKKGFKMKLSLTDLNELTILNLSDTGIKEIHPDIFKLKNLKHLDLSGNLIEELQISSGNLKTIDCSWNQIEVVKIDSPRLQVLHLHYNSIVDCNIQATNLRNLSLDFNKVKKLDLNSSTRLELLSVADNGMTDLSFNPINMKDFISFDNDLRFKEDDKLLHFFKKINFIDYEVISRTNISGLL